MKSLHYIRLITRAAIIPSMFAIALTGAYWIAGIMAVLLSGIWALEKLGIYED